MIIGLWCNMNSIIDELWVIPGVSLSPFSMFYSVLFRSIPFILPVSKDRQKTQKQLCQYMIIIIVLSRTAAVYVCSNVIDMKNHVPHSLLVVPKYTRPQLLVLVHFLKCL